MICESELRRLRDMVRRHRVGFWVEPDDVRLEGRVVEVTFQLKLVGMHDGAHSNAVLLCRRCGEVLTTLFEVVDALLPFERRSAAQMNLSYEKRMRYTRASDPQYGVCLGFELRMRRPFEQANDGWAMEFLMALTKLLRELACNQFDGPADAESCIESVAEKPPYKTELQEERAAAS